MGKPKFAMYWAAACGGCDVAVLDLAEKFLEVADLFDVVFWPIAVDFKYSDVEKLADGEIDLCLFSGAVRNSEQEEMAHLLRRKSKVLVAYGSCAYLGGIPALANFFKGEDLLSRAYREVPSLDNPDGVLPSPRAQVPEGELEIPQFFNTVRSLDQVVRVDYYVPGCPPPVEITARLVDLYAKGELPPLGSVVASDKNVCDECERKKEQKKISRLRRPHEVIPEPERCLLEQGLICAGPATRGGCGSRCIKANMPCRGCFGPPPGVPDQGAALVAAVASIYEARDEAEVERMLAEVVDPAGTFYRFSLAASLLRRAKV